MPRIIGLLSLLLLALSGSAQTNALRYKIMVVPYIKEGEKYRTVLDADANRRIAVTKVKEGFDNNGFTTVDFIGKLNALQQEGVFKSEDQMDVKAKVVQESGCDIYVVVDVSSEKTQNISSISVAVTAYEAATGISLSNKVGRSGGFATNDLGGLTSRAVDKCMDEFITMLQERINNKSVSGNSVAIHFNLAEGAGMNMHSTFGPNKLYLSDFIEDWLAHHSLGGDYHIQGTTQSEMIVDDLKIPLKDTEGNSYTVSRYAIELFKFLQANNLSPDKDIKGNTIFITINK